MSITLDELSLRFGRHDVLRRISVTLPKTGLVALVGPNGAGKSSLMDVLCGFRRASAGQVLMAKRSLGPSKLRKISCRLHQGVVLPEGLTTGAFLAVAGEPSWTLAELLRSENEARAWMRVEQDAPLVSRLLHGAGVTDPSQVIARLSWGQQRAVALGAVLSRPCQVVLLDEPFVGLSASVRTDVQSALAALSQDRLVVVAEHDLDSLVTLCTRFLVLRSGELIADYQGSDVTREQILQHWWDTDAE